MNTVTKLLTDHIDVWTAADTEKKSGRGRSAADSGSVYGIKKLRELILDLAVRGKLVPQDSNDEPSNQLLKRIEIDRAFLRKNGSIKPEKPYPRIDTKEAPFPVPDGWTWVNLAQIGHDWGQTTPEGQFTYIEVSAIDSNLGIVSSPELVEANDAPSRARKIVRSGTVIYSTVRPYLRNIAVIEDDFSPSPIASTAFAVIHPFCEMPPRYILAYLRSPPFVRYVESVQTGIAYPAINDKQFFSGLFPLPPLAEQHRIVAKVDELMALCDQLEAGHAGAAEAHENLVTQLLGTLTASENAEDFAANWQRIATHFDTLFSTEVSIDALKQTIRELAIMGKLVPQDPNDEPAIELLNRIKNQKARLIREKIIRGGKPLEPIEISDWKHAIPSGWQVVRFGEIGDWGAGATPSRSVASYYGGDIKWFKSGELSNDFIDTSEETITERALKECSLRLNKIGDVLIAMYGATIGKASILNSVGTTNQAVCACSPFDGIDNRYLLLVLKAMRANFIGQGAGGAQPNISREKIIATAFAVCPTAEQHRIVAKVDQLMSMCDQLKTRLSEANRVQQTLADAIVTQAVA